MAKTGTTKKDPHGIGSTKAIGSKKRRTGGGGSHAKSPTPKKSKATKSAKGQDKDKDKIRSQGTPPSSM
jgi:hypothetical protein